MILAGLDPTARGTVDTEDDVKNLQEPRRNTSDEETIEGVLRALPERDLDAAPDVAGSDDALDGVCDRQQPTLVLAVGVDGDR